MQHKSDTARVLKYTKEAKEKRKKKGFSLFWNISWVLKQDFFFFFHFRFGKVSLNLTRNVDVFWHPIGKDWNNENEFKNLIEVASNMQVTQRLHFIF